jgi:hypothetical protein
MPRHSARGRARPHLRARGLAHGPSPTSLVFLFFLAATLPASPFVSPAGVAAQQAAVDAPVEAAPRDAQASTEAAPGDAQASTEAAAGDADENAGAVSDDGAPRATDAGGAVAFHGRFRGEYELRMNGLSNIPLRAMPREAGTDSLGQNAWLEQWIRLRAEVGLRPHLRLSAQADVLDGIVVGDTAVGVWPAEWRRDRRLGFGTSDQCTRERGCERYDPGMQLRDLYLEWDTGVGVLRAGQQAFHWGLGIVANDGDHPPPFGDYRYGDLVERVLFATRPFGKRSPLVVAVAGDVVFDDGLFDLRRGDLALQGVLSVFYERGKRVVGGFVAYRDARSALGDVLEVGVVDLHAAWNLPEPSGGEVFAAFEGAYVFGTTSLARTLYRSRDRVEQMLCALQIGRRGPVLDVMVEAGYASGDADVDDGVQRRATFDGDHRIGLILFPEVMAWQTARAAAYAASPELVARAGRGVELVPTNGGVAGAMYLFPQLRVYPSRWLEVRLGAVLARTTAPGVDPVEQRLTSRSVNYRGGDPSFRDLGLELDAALLVTGALSQGVHAVAGVEGGVLFPGQALADETGALMNEVGMVRGRLGLRW